MAGSSLVAEELRRIAGTPPLLVLPFIFLVLNGALIFGNSWLFPLMREIGVVAEEAGARMDEGFLRALEARPASDVRDQLAFSVSHAESMLSDFDAGSTAAEAADVMDVELASRVIALKYAVWGHRVAEVRTSGQERDMYGAGYTFELHQDLFGTLVPVVILEGSGMGAAALLYMNELDERRGVRSFVLSSHVGRRVVTTRFFAALLWALVTYALVSGITFGAFALLSGWGFGPAWESSVSSLFNVLVDGASARPFVTWIDCSVGSYLMLSLLLGLGFVILLCLTVHVLLMATGCGAVRAAVFAVVLATAPLGVQAVCVLCGWQAVGAVMYVFPAPLLDVSDRWFTDLGYRFFIPWQESASVVGGIALLWCACLVVRRAWLGKDVA